MDNQLIFWYRQSSDHDEVRDANHPKPSGNLFVSSETGGAGGGAWDPSG